MFSSLRATVVLLGLSLFTACGPKEVPKEEVEKQAMAVLTQSVGQQAPPITCPGNLKAEVGASLVCAITLEGKVHDVNVKVTGVDGSTAKFDVSVADKPRA